MNKKEQFNYFDEFANNAKYSLQCAEMLYEILKDFKKNNLEENLRKMHEFENAGDQGKHKVTNYLVKDFLPPIERDDIMELLNEIDNVTDNIEDILINLDIFNVEKVKPIIVDFAKLLMDCCKLEYEVVEEFKNFKKSKTLAEKIIALNKLEEDGDKIYINSMRLLYREKEDMLSTYIWSKIYNCFEKCYDTCEHVANNIETIALNNA